MGKKHQNDSIFRKLSKRYAKRLKDDKVPEGETMSPGARAARDQLLKRIDELNEENNNDTEEPNNQVRSRIMTTQYFVIRTADVPVIGITGDSNSVMLTIADVCNVIVQNEDIQALQRRLRMAADQLESYKQEASL